MTGDLLAQADSLLRVTQRTEVEGADVFLLRDHGMSVVIEKGAVTSAESETSSGFGIRVLRQGRVGFAYGSNPKEAKGVVEAALKASRLSKPLPRFAFPGPRKAPRVEGVYDSRLVSLEPAQLLEGARRMLDAVKEVRGDLVATGGGLHAGSAEYAIANTEGVRVAHRATGIGGSCYVVQSQHGVSTGVESRSSTRLDLDFGALGTAAARLAVDSERPKPLERARALPCLVRPDAASDLLSTITIPSLYGKPARRGESYYSGKLGRAVAHARLSLIDDARRSGGLGSAPFDDEGLPSQATALIRRGRLTTFLFDTAAAAEYKTRPTGHGIRSHSLNGRSYRSPPSTSARQVTVEAPHRSTDRLIAGVDEGLLAYDLMGVHTANTVSGDFSVTSGILFRIRNGAVEGPVKPLSIAGNVHETLKRGLVLGDDVKEVGGEPAFALPTVAFDGFSATP